MSSLKPDSNYSELEHINQPKNVEFSVPKKGKLSVYLIICCITVALGPFQFGYNISSLNPVTPIIKEFVFNELFVFQKLFHQRKALFQTMEGYLIGNETLIANAIYNAENMRSQYIECQFMFNYTCMEELTKYRNERVAMIKAKFNMTPEEFMPIMQKRLKDGRAMLESKRPLLVEGEKKVRQLNNLIWAVVNALFIVGGMIGALSSKFIMDKMGRKGGLLFHNVFSVIGAALAFISLFVKSPICLAVGRLFMGIQSGATCSIAPAYLNEISPVNLRGRIGLLTQLGITSGILIAQILGLNFLLGNQLAWHYLVAMPMVPAVIGNIILLFFFPETPMELLKKDEHEAKRALQMFRNTPHVGEELYEMSEIIKASQSEEAVPFRKLFKIAELRAPLLVVIVLQVAQQLSGVNAIFFYSADIFVSAGVREELIQYAILTTGIVNFTFTLVAIPLIDRFGRKPLLLVPIAIIIVDFLALTVFMIKKETFPPYLSVICILIFLVSFSVGLGGIPFVYTAECFRQNERSAAMALAVTVNWSATLLLTLAFPILQMRLGPIVFSIFSVIMAAALIILYLKMVETKGKKPEDIVKEYNKNK